MWSAIRTRYRNDSRQDADLSVVQGDVSREVLQHRITSAIYNTWSSLMIGLVDPLFMMEMIITLKVWRCNLIQTTQLKSSRVHWIDSSINLLLWKELWFGKIIRLCLLDLSRWPRPPLAASRLRSDLLK